MSLIFVEVRIEVGGGEGRERGKLRGNEGKVGGR